MSYGRLPPTPRQKEVLAAFVAAGGSVAATGERLLIRQSTVKRYLEDLRARSGLATLQIVYAGRCAGWLRVPELEPEGLHAGSPMTSGCAGGRGRSIRRTHGDNSPARGW